VKKKSQNTGTITNKRARFDYDIKDEFVAGIVLNGAEVKSLRMGHGNLRGGFITLKDNEAWLNNLQITPTNNTAAVLTEENQSRIRKLLLKKRELDNLKAAKDQGLAIVPIKILTKGRYIKVVFATGKGKKMHDKRSKIKERDTNRDINREIKRH
jgi:SsrA-binding protein